MSKKKGRRQFLVNASLLVVILAALGIFQVSQTQERSQLEAELTAAEKNLADLQSDESQLELENMREQLARALAFFESARADLARPLDSIEANEAIFRIAAETGVLIMDIATASDYAGELDEVTVQVLPLTVEADGSAAQLLAFITALNNDIPNGLVGAATLMVPELASGLGPSAAVEVAIYQYRGE